MSVESNLGIKEMPNGYKLMRNSDGFYFWKNEINKTESSISWNKWQIYRCAIANSKLQTV